MNKATGYGSQMAYIAFKYVLPYICITAIMEPACSFFLPLVLNIRGT